MSAGLIGGIIGGILGILGGVIGTYCSITNTESPAEKAFMIKASIVAWVAVTLFLILMFVLPTPYRFWLWVPYGILLPLGIMKINKRISEIREIENAT